MKVGNTTKEANSQTGSWRHNILKTITVTQGTTATKNARLDDSMKLLPTKSKRSTLFLMLN